MISISTTVPSSGVGGGGDVVYGGVEVGGEVEVAPSSHHNGIEELLRASAYAPAEGLQQYQGYRTMEEIE